MQLIEPAERAKIHRYFAWVEERARARFPATEHTLSACPDGHSLRCVCEECVAGWPDLAWELWGNQLTDWEARDEP